MESNGKLIFDTNVPVDLSLKYTVGKRVESKFGGEQMMFSSSKGVFFVAGVVGDILGKQLEDLEVKPGEPVRICKREVPDGRGRKAIRWQVERAEDTAIAREDLMLSATSMRPRAQAQSSMGEQPDGTFAVPKETHLERQLKASIEHAETRKTNGNGKPAPETKPAIATGWAQFLLQNTNALVDVFAASLQHASQYGGAVKPEDVRSILLSAFINQSKNGANYGDR